MSETRTMEQKAVLSMAKGLLGEAGNRVKLILGLLVAIFSTVSILLVVSAISFLVDFDALYASSIWFGALVEFALILMQFILILFFGAPIYLGLYSAALKMRRGLSVDLSDFFTFFDSPSAYFRGWGIVIRVVGRAYPFLLLYGVSVVATLTGLDVLNDLTTAATFPLAVLGLYTTGRSYPFITFALCNPDMPLGRTMKNVKAMTCKKTPAIFVFRMRLYLRFLLSLVSVGVITLMHTLPLTILATHEFSFALAREQGTSSN